jgi:hypothetical protein
MKQIYQNLCCPLFQSSSNKIGFGIVYLKQCSAAEEIRNRKLAILSEMKGKSISCDNLRLHPHKIYFHYGPAIWWMPYSDQSVRACVRVCVRHK